MTKKANIEFEDMNLQVGVRLQIMPSKAANPSVHYTSLIGFVSGEYLLLKIPQEGAVLHEGDSVIIRVFSGVSVYTFSSQVESVLKSPHAMICLLYTSPSPRDGLLSRMPSSA